MAYLKKSTIKELERLTDWLHKKFKMDSIGVQYGVKFCELSPAQKFTAYKQFRSNLMKEKKYNNFHLTNEFFVETFRDMLEEKEYDAVEMLKRVISHIHHIYDVGSKIQSINE
jgi:hypothetical protein